MIILALAKFLLKTILRNTSFWIWSIVFMLFWAFMGAYVFSRNITKERLIETGIPEFLLDEAWSSVVRSYTSGWFSTIVTISYAGLAGVLVTYVYASSIPVRFLNKYSKITAKGYFLSNVIGVVIVSKISLLIMYTAVFSMYKHRFGIDFIPYNPLGVVASSLLYAVNTYLLSTSLALVAILARKPGLVDKLTYAPLTLGVAFVMLSIYVGGDILYLSPFNSAMALIYYYSSGVKPPADEPLALARGDYRALEPINSWITQVTWLMIMAILSIYMYERQKGVAIEDII